MSRRVYLLLLLFLFAAVLSHLLPQHTGGPALEEAVAALGRSMLG